MVGRPVHHEGRDQFASLKTITGTQDKRLPALGDSSYFSILDHDVVLYSSYGAWRSDLEDVMYGRVSDHQTDLVHMVPRFSR